MIVMCSMKKGVYGKLKVILVAKDTVVNIPLDLA
jgi:hypothetical protein